MEVINLSKKVIVPIMLNGMECICVLDSTSIEHYQRNNKIGFLRGLQAIEKNEISGIRKLVGSIVREKKTNRILGEKYFKEYDPMQIVTVFTPIIKQLMPNLPTAKNDSEKK